MNFWLVTLLFNLLIPVVMLIKGILYVTKPAPKINWLHGYRTKRSVKSQETWEYAQRHFGKSCCRLGIGLLLLVIISMTSVLKTNKEIIGTVGSLVGTLEGLAMTYALIPTEKALKKTFDV